MKTLILPIDIKSRELQARLLHALLALERGWTVITGSKTLINRNLWRLPRGVYLFSTIGEGRLRGARWLKRMGFASQGWDEEGLIYGDRATYRQMRLHADTMRLVDQIFAWGEESAKDMQLVAKDAGKQVEVAGNPRLDLLRPELRGLLDPEAEELRQQHGEFILFATNLSWANPHVLPPEQQDLQGDAPPPGREGAWRYLQYQKHMLKAFREAVAQVAQTFPNHKVIVRPHPVENAEAWQKWLDHCPNVEIIRKGAMLPWAYAAAAFVHSNSTTGLETRLLGRHPIAFVPFRAPQQESPLPNGVSLQATNTAQLVEHINKVLNGSATTDARPAELIRRHLHMPETELCTMHFVRRAEELLDTPARPLATAFTRSYLWLRYLQKSLRRNHARDIHRRNIFPDTSQEEIGQHLNRLAKVLDKPHLMHIEIREITPNIFRLEPPA